MRTCTAVVEHVSLLALMHVKLVDYAPWVLVVGEAAFNVAIVAERLGLRLSAAAQPDWCVCGDRNSERIDHGDGAIEQIEAVANYNDCHVAEVADGDHIRSGVRSDALDPDRAKALWAKSEEMVDERF
jgi:hypothetical protein